MISFLNAAQQIMQALELESHFRVAVHIYQLKWRGFIYILFGGGKMLSQFPQGTCRRGCDTSDPPQIQQGQW